MTHRYELLVNGDAGGTDRAGVSAAADVLGGHTVVRETASAADVDEVVAGLDGPTTLVVCGGDGSVHVAVAALRRAGRLDVPIGVIPAGTGNDLIRGLGLPLDPIEAAVTIRDGHPRPLDLLVSDDAICCNAVHVGVGAEASERADGLKDQMGEVAYPVGAFLAGFAAEGHAIEVTVDGETHADALSLLVAVCNGSTIGGGTPIAPEAQPDDGLLDVVVCQATGPVERAAFAASTARGAHVRRDDVRVLRGRQVALRATGLREVIDGEIGAMPETRRWELEHPAWYLRC